MKKRLDSRWLVFAGIVGSSALGCEMPDDATGPDNGAGDGEALVDEADIASKAQALYSYSGDRLWPGGIVPVCFSAASYQEPDFAARSAEIHAWIDETWGRAANLRFDGWGACPANPGSVIRINLNNSGGCSSWVGYNPSGPTDMYLGTKYWAWHAGVVHEFGHALGFEHEFDRTDSDNCNGTGQIGGGNTWGTEHDKESMLESTYCGNTRTELSAWDVVGLRNAYGTKPAGYVVGQGNNCLDVPDYGDKFTSSHQLQSWSCWGGENQKWTYSAVSKTFSGRSAYTTKSYMDVQWGATADGTPVWNWVYNNDPAQKWDLLGVRIKGLGDMCLDVPGASYYSGQSVQLWQCHGGANQNWNVRGGHNGSSKDFYISPSARPDLCLAYNIAYNSGTSSYDYSLKLKPCVNNPSDLADWFQRFYFSDGRISASAADFTVVGGRPVNGAAVELRSTKSTAFDQSRYWHITGPIRGKAGKCLDLNIAYPLGDGTPVQLWTCNGWRNQDWDYYF